MRIQRGKLTDVVLALGLAMAAISPAFGQSDETTLAPPDAVESGTLAPLTPVAPVETAPMSPPPGSDNAPASGFSAGFWQGTSLADASAAMAKAGLPLRSPTLARLWRQAMLTNEEAAGGAPGQFLAMRLDGLYRAGLLKDAAALIAQSPKTTDAVQLAAAAHVLLGLGDDGKACAAVKAIPLSGGPLKGRARNDALLMVAYCAARDKQPNHASLAAEVMRDQHFAEPLALAVLDSLAESKTPKLPRTDNLTLIDYKFLSLLGNVPAERFLPRATPDVIVAIASDPTADPVARLGAAEAAARINAIEDADLAALYRAAAFQPQQLADPGSALPALPPQMQRALLFLSAEHEASPARKSEAVRQLLATARRDAIFAPIARLAAPLLDAVRPTPDLAAESEPAVEALLAAGRFDHAVGWTLLGGTTAGPGGNPLLHWLALVDIGDGEGHVPHGSAMKYAEDLATGGGFSPIMLQRLATVLDALHYDVPAGIQQAAQSASASISKADQGRAPDAGVLAKLAAAGDARSAGAAVLWTIANMGGEPATAAHPTALSAAIKALEAVGLDADARRLALEALIEAWPPRVTGLSNGQ